MPLNELFRGQLSKEPGIIYCATRKTLEFLTRRLQDKGISAGAYHGGMADDIRHRNQDDFIHNQTRIIAAAYGIMKEYSESALKEMATYFSQDKKQFFKDKR